MIARRSPTPVKLDSRQVTTVAKVRTPGSRIAGARVGLRHAACGGGRGVERVREGFGRGAERGAERGADEMHRGLQWRRGGVAEGSRRGCAEGCAEGCGPQ